MAPACSYRLGQRASPGTRRSHLGAHPHCTEEETGPTRQGAWPETPQPRLRNLVSVLPSIPPPPPVLSTRRHCTKGPGVILKSAKLNHYWLIFAQHDMHAWTAAEAHSREFLSYLKLVRQGPRHPEHSPAPREEEAGAGFSSDAAFSWQRRDGWRRLLAQNHFKAWTASSSQQAARNTCSPRRL